MTHTSQSIDDNTLKPTLWLIDDDPALRLVLEDTFNHAGIKVVSFANAHGAWTQLNDIKSKPDITTKLPQVILTDIRMPMMDGLSFSQWLNTHFSDIPVIIMTAHSDLQSAIDSYQTGIFEYLPKPFDLDDAVALIHKAIRQTQTHSHSHSSQDNTVQTQTVNNTKEESKNHSKKKPKQQTQTAVSQGTQTHIHSTQAQASQTQPIQTQPTNQTTPSRTAKDTDTALKQATYGIIGQSTAMQAVFRAIGRLANTPISVLITGESGTGKELVAHALHQTSPRKTKPFIALNMSAIPHDLIESELFGHEKGAFTGATTSRQGRFEQADGGTLFLDEIGDMPFNTQTRLLRVLANGEFFRVGGKDPIQVDVRIISATHQNLEQLVKQGKFREDLFYRLNVIRLPLPALRKRTTDIPALLTHFLQRSATELATTTKSIDPSAMQVLQSYPWHGNVRQLENTCRWLTVMTSTDTVYIEDLPPELLEHIEQDIEQTLAQNSVRNNANFQQSPAYGFDNRLSQHPDDDIKHTQPNVTHNTEDWLTPLNIWTKTQLKQGNNKILTQAKPEFERVLLNATLLHCKGNKGKAAQLLGWGRNTLARKIKQLNLEDRW